MNTIIATTTDTLDRIRYNCIEENPLIEKMNVAYSKLLIDVDFERLNLILKKPNIFAALNISSYEIRHSNFLAWLLTPNGNHGLQDIFLRRILIDILGDNRAVNINTVDIPKLIKQSVFVHREWSNIDILIEFDDTVIAIENKIRSSEHSNQLQRYFQIVEEHFQDKRQIFCYLTPQGNQSSMDNRYIELGYNRIVLHLEDIFGLYKSSLNSKVQVYIQDYIENLKLNVMADSEANDLAREIYNNHRELFDFIIDNKPDAASDFLPIIKLFFERKGFVPGSPNKGYFRFLTLQLAEIFEPYDKNFGGFTYREPFLFEIDFFWTKGKMIFKAIASPSEYSLKEKLLGLLDSIEGAKKPSGKKWATYFIVHQNFKLDDIHFKDEVEIQNILEQLYGVISPIIEKIETKFLENKELLLAHSNYPS